MKEEFSSLYGVSLNFRYVPSLQNPADLTTRGLTFKKFQENLDFWTKGPSWLGVVPVVWPVSDLRCLRDDDKETIQSRVLCTPF